MVVKKLWLNSHVNARRTLSRLIKDFHASEENVQEFRAKVYAIKTLLDFFEFEKNIELENRLEELESKIIELSRFKNVV